MRILLVNPNMTRSMTERMTAVAARVAPSGAEIVPLTASRGFPYISSCAEAQVAGAIACEMIAEHAEGIDAVIIAAFGDPGLAGARELFDVPVVGMAEAAIFSAAMLGERISIVTFSPVMRRWYGDAVRDAGLLSRFTGVRTPTHHGEGVDGVPDALRAELLRLCAAAATEDGADVVILGGAPLAGLAEEIGPEVDVPLVDAISAATLQAIALTSLVRTQNLAKRSSKSHPKVASGLSDALARRFAGRSERHDG